MNVNDVYFVNGALLKLRLVTGTKFHLLSFATFELCIDCYKLNFKLKMHCTVDSKALLHGPYNPSIGLRAVGSSSFNQSSEDSSSYTPLVPSRRSAVFFFLFFFL